MSVSIGQAADNPWWWNWLGEFAGGLLCTLGLEVACWLQDKPAPAGTIYLAFCIGSLFWRTRPK